MKDLGMNYCRIRQNQIWVNGTVVFSNDAACNPQEFLKAAYSNFDIKYPKFHKMDALCQAGIVAAELLFAGLTDAEKAQTGVCLSNKSSSMVSDVKHVDQFAKSESKVASPSTFVYTLPNIVIGEICIKHQLRGENVFFISQKPDWDAMIDFANDCFSNNLAASMLVGWVEVNHSECDVFVILCQNQTKDKAAFMAALNEL